ncbi:uncharacterized protein MELLADRAFT_110771 [Melampsora larici-populina 98AG31]|uniref:Uncharacterized protein n=1 Tax=Melampsora larici-populina (strain 98AG31 / pathotype 3-4-7) TaxID=747676 RepID=F4S0X2_MELLP|nr:uncharacterized protein MELLADRAFT_110771 [Melampsora larici-populina 98AG31]EGG01735.1 hypothetical protein MELLADRAFT_110771 [Melampsora larici-populina 98AG31]
MRDVVIPTGITRLPLNLGETKHGKLKAAQWHSLFAYVIPLIILELYVDDPQDIPMDSNKRNIIVNIGYLTQCTNIVCAKSVSDADANHFESLYKKYTLSSKKIFHNLIIKPNHHYALHIPEQIRMWGPLGQVAEFAGERLIGVLQNFWLTYGIYVSGEMDRTMMRRFCQLQRLMADHPIVEDISLGDDPGPLNSRSQEKKNRIELDDEEYEALLSYVQIKSPDARDHRKLPHPPNAKVFQPYVAPTKTWKVSDRVSVSVLKPNNCIEFKQHGKVQYGFVRQIYHFATPEGKWNTVFLVNPINNLFPKDLDSTSKDFRYILFLLKAVVGIVEEEFTYLSPQSVSCVAAYRLLPPHTFGIAEAGIILRPSDYNSQLSI